MKRIASVRKQPTAISPFSASPRSSAFWAKSCACFSSSRASLTTRSPTGVSVTPARMMADEQRHADFGFELGDRARNRGLRHIEALGRLGDVPAIGGGHHVAQLAQGQVHRILHQENPMQDRQNKVFYRFSCAAQSCVQIKRAEARR